MGRNNYHACWELVGFKRTLWSEVPRPPCSAGAQRRFVNQLPIDRQAVKPWQVLIERTLPDPEDVMAFAADHLSHQPLLWPVGRMISLIGIPPFDRPKIVALASSRRR
ncbi:hypothetical protein ABIA96_006514 [Bradyrhizobium sp. LB11.1]